MSDLREAARRALAEASGPADSGAEVVRATVDVRAGDSVEMVSLAVRDGRLIATCSCGVPNCPHLREAIRAVAGEVGMLRLGGGATEESVRSSPGSLRSVPPPSGRDSSPSGDGWRTSLAEALDDLVTAVVRSGAASKNAPSVDETVEQVLRTLPSPTPLGASRWVGRLRAALAGGHIAGTSRLLDEATRIADDLRAPSPGDDGKKRLASFVGRAGSALPGVDGIDRVYDRSFIDVGREIVGGVERAGIERRYLVDLESGEVFREERARSAAAPFIGPCPCVIQAGFAEIEAGPPPRRIHFLQYAVMAGLGPEDWGKIGAAAIRKLRPLADGYRRTLLSFPGLAEPFAIVAPAGHSAGEGLTLLDDDRDPLPIARAEDPSATAALAEMIGRLGAPAWVAGRLVDAKGVLLLFPISAAFAHDGTMVFRRIT